MLRSLKRELIHIEDRSLTDLTREPGLRAGGHSPPTRISNTLSRAEMLQMRQGVIAFCSKDNLDCPEIMQLIGKAE